MTAASLHALRILLGRSRRDRPSLLAGWWRQLQLIELVEQCPLPTERIACPACGGGGERCGNGMTPAGVCPGDCCGICAFCTGRRFFRASELIVEGIAQRHGASVSATVSVADGTRERIAGHPRDYRLNADGAASVDVPKTRWLRLPDRLRAEHATIRPARAHVRVPLTEEDARFIHSLLDDGETIRDPHFQSLREELSAAYPVAAVG